MDINKFDLINLMDLDSLKREEKEALRKEIEELITTQFFADRLDKLLPAKDLVQVSGMAERNEPLDKIIDFIISKVPTIGDIMLEYITSSKKDFILHHYETALADLKETLEIKREKSGDVQAKYERYLKVKELIETDAYSTALSVLRRDTSN